MSQRLKSVQSLMDHLLEENVISQKEYDTIRNCTSVKQQTGQLIDLVLSKGNAAAEVFRNWIKKNDVYLLRELMGMWCLNQIWEKVSVNFQCYMLLVYVSVKLYGQ